MLVLAGVVLLPVIHADADEPAKDAKADATPKTTAHASAEAAANSHNAFEVYPAAIHLVTRADKQTFVVRMRRGDGVTLDLTEKVKVKVADPSIASVKGNLVTPGSDGKTELIIEHQGKTTKLPIVVERAAEDRPISFRLDVLPVFAKASCNNGACHGSARGQDGFNLSLFGYDPKGDYQRILFEQPGRRVNLADPEKSLLLTKSINAVPHTGGKLFEKNHAFYDTIHGWLEAGAPDDPADVAKVTGLQIVPQDIVLEGPGASQQVTVRAHYSDGTDRDVTELAVLMTSNKVSADINDEGIITADKRGEAFVMARFDEFTVGTPVIVVPHNSADGYPEKLSEANYIDKHVNTKLRKMRIVPSDLCDDATYARRVHIDIAGKLPEVERLDAFVKDKDPNKRAKLVDELLESQAFVDIWVMKWAERLKIRSSNNNNDISPKAAVLYHTWLKDQLGSNRPMNDVVYDLIASTGGTFDTPATNYYELERDTLKRSENVVQVFLGARMQCAQCHNHPFDRWTMDDYYGFAAFFSQVARKRAADPREWVVFNRGSGEIKHPLDGREMKPQFLGGEVVEIQRGKDRREVLAKWLTSPENRPFNRNLANFTWEHFFGRGITHPIDDVRISNPPVNAPLLDALADRLVETDYDMRQLVRDICASHTYQRSSRANETNVTDETNFSRSKVRRIRAEVLLDCITQVTQTEDDFRGLPPGARAVEIVDGNTSTFFLTTFGRASRETVCSCEVVTEPNLSQALHLINGSTLNNKIRQGGIVRQMLKEDKEPAEVIKYLYRAALSRPPTQAELDRVLGMVETSEDKPKALEDVFWALMNAKEFIFNH